MRGVADILEQTPRWVQDLLGTPLQIAFIVLGAIVVRWIAHRLIGRIAEGIATGRGGLGRLDDRLPTATAFLTSSPLLSARREQRARTTASVLKSATTAAVAVVAGLTVLDTLQVSITPLLASAGVLGVALGFGAQTMIKDLISGIFIIVEDQYGVGDVVELGDITGSVESVGLRVTRLRGADGTVWYIRNGEILKVGNRSQGWARAVLDVGLPKGQDVAKAQALLVQVARELRKDEDFADMVVEDPQVWGIESITADGVAVRLVVKTAPLRQWAVVRELRRRILERFDAEGLPRPTGLEAPSVPTGLE
jgi:small conductance mechanosensitive channel